MISRSEDLSIYACKPITDQKDLKVDGVSYRKKKGLPLLNSCSTNIQTLPLDFES